jgi:hypothetical protein
MANQAPVSRFAASTAKAPVSGLAVSVDEKAGTLTITMPLSPAGTPSKSGKSIQIASTGGNKTVRLGDLNVKLGVNCYVEN